MVNGSLNIGWECSRANEREHGARRRVEAGAWPHAACVRGDSTVVAGEGRYIVLLPMCVPLPGGSRAHLRALWVWPLRRTSICRKVNATDASESRLTEVRANSHHS